jgi:SAM-dependent methyltransferase
MDSIDSYKDNLTKMISNETDENGYDNLQADKDGFEYMLNSPYVVGYSSVSEQQYIFQNLLLGYNSNLNSLLDIGCGRADLYGYITDTYKEIVSYNGLDHNANMADIAKQKYNIDIQVGAFETAKLEKADWVVASGFFTPRRCETEDKDLQKLFEDIDKMYSLANNCVSFNLLSPIGNEVAEGFFYVHPGLVMDMLIEKYRYVTVRNNYSNDVYTVTIYKY